MTRLDHNEVIKIHKRERARHQVVPPSEDGRAAEMARYAALNYTDEVAASMFNRDSDGTAYPYGPPWNAKTQAEIAARAVKEAP